MSIDVASIDMVSEVNMVSGLHITQIAVSLRLLDRITHATTPQTLPPLSLHWHPYIMVSLLQYSADVNPSFFSFQAIMWCWDGWAGFPVSNKTSLSQTHTVLAVLLYTHTYTHPYKSSAYGCKKFLKHTQLPAPNNADPQTAAPAHSEDRLKLQQWLSQSIPTMHVQCKE